MAWRLPLKPSLSPDKKQKWKWSLIRPLMGRPEWERFKGSLLWRIAPAVRWNSTLAPSSPLKLSTRKAQPCGKVIHRFYEKVKNLHTDWGSGGSRSDLFPNRV